MQKKKKKTQKIRKIRKDARDVVHKKLYKIYYKTSIIIYSIDIVGTGFAHFYRGRSGFKPN